MYTIAITGHRPPKIGGYDLSSPQRNAVFAALRARLKAAEAKHGPIRLITGGALGVDQDAACIAIAHRWPVSIVEPFAGFDARWPQASRDEYALIRDRATKVVTLHPGPYSARLMQARNEYMVDHADAVLAVWDGSPGGTANCVAYAQSKNVAIARIDPTEVQFDQNKEECP